MSFATLPCLLPSLLLGQSEPEPEPPTPSALEVFASRLKVEGGADVYYGYNFNRPADGANFIPGTGTTGKRDNEFTLNLASLGVSLEPAPVGFRVLVGIGTAMEVVHAAEPVGTATGPDVWRFLQQASLSYAHGPLTLEVRPVEHLVLKLEARHDRSTADVFGGPETSPEGTPVPRSTQTLVVAGATAFF